MSRNNGLTVTEPPITVRVRVRVREVTVTEPLPCHCPREFQAKFLQCCRRFTSNEAEMSRFKIQDSRLDLESEQREACLLLLLPPAVDPVNKATVSVRELRVILTMAQFTCSAMSNVNVLRLLNELLSNMN